MHYQSFECGLSIVGMFMRCWRYSSYVILEFELDGTSVSGPLDLPFRCMIAGPNSYLLPSNDAPNLAPSFKIDSVGNE